MRCLPGSRGRTSVTHLKSLVAATVLAVPYLLLPVTPADAACETNERLDRWGAVLLTAGACASQVTLAGLRIDPWRGREAGELARIADLAAGRWGVRSSDRFAQPADDGSAAWLGSLEMTGRGLLFVSSSLLAVTDSAAPMRVAIEHDRRGDGLVGPFGADCERSRLLATAPPSYGAGEGDGGYSAGFRYELGDSLSGVHPPVQVALTERFTMPGALAYPTNEPTPTECNGDGSGGPLRLWRAATGISPSTPDLNGGAGTSAEPGAALAFGPHRPRDLGEASLAHLHAYPDNRIEWNGHRRVALSRLCFESEGRNRC